MGGGGSKGGTRASSNAERGERTPAGMKALGKDFDIVGRGMKMYLDTAVKNGLTPGSGEYKAASNAMLMQSIAQNFANHTGNVPMDDKHAALAQRTAKFLDSVAGDYPEHKSKQIAAVAAGLRKMAVDPAARAADYTTRSYATKPVRALSKLGGVLFEGLTGLAWD